MIHRRIARDRHSRRRGGRMEFQRVHLGNQQRWRALAVLGAAAALLVAVPARADTLKTPGDPQIDPDPASATTFAETADGLTLTRPASAGAPGYTLTIAKQPFQLTTSRGGATVPATTRTSDTTAAARFASGGPPAPAEPPDPPAGGAWFCGGPTCPAPGLPRSAAPAPCSRSTSPRTTRATT